MKESRAKDYWRRLEHRDLKGHLLQFSGTSIPNMPSSPVPVTGAITIITGLNGVGKSSLLHCAGLLLRRAQSVTVELPSLRACDGILKAQLLENGAPVDLITTIQAGKVTAAPEIVATQFTWIDPAFEIPALIKEFRQEQNLNEALEQVGPSIADGEELKQISYVVGKEYEICETYELEDFAARAVTPYFWVKAAGMEYGTEAMGLGEASLHYMLWNLKRMPKDSVVLIEEPETYVSARSQSNFMDVVAKICGEKNASAIVTTHSPQVFAKVPPQHTLILVKEGNQTSIVVKDTPAARLLVLGVPPIEEKSGVLLVEDRVARLFATAWLKSICPDLLRSWRVLDVSSSGQVLSKLEHFPKMGGWFRAIGLLDGDEREKKHQPKGPLCFLPGKLAPEMTLRDAIRAKPDEIAKRLKTDGEVLRLAITALDGQDHHDWLLNLVKALDPQAAIFDNFLQIAYEVWDLEKDNHDAAVSSFDELFKIISAEN